MAEPVIYKSWSDFFKNDMLWNKIKTGTAKAENVILTRIEFLKHVGYYAYSEAAYKKHVKQVEIIKEQPDLFD